MTGICALAVMLSFSVHHPERAWIFEMSDTYQAKWSRSFETHHKECLTLASVVEDIPYVMTHSERLLVLSIAAVETSFDNSLVSTRGARSSMQTYRRYSPCGDCDLRVAGAMHIIRLKRKYGVCGGAARYNAGPRGTCEGIGKYYARDVMWIHERLKAASFDFSR